jgi:hypothetical protein
MMMRQIAFVVYRRQIQKLDKINYVHSQNSSQLTQVDLVCYLLTAKEEVGVAFVDLLMERIRRES